MDSTYEGTKEQQVVVVGLYAAKGGRGGWWKNLDGWGLSKSPPTYVFPSIFAIPNGFCSLMSVILVTKVSS